MNNNINNIDFYNSVLYQDFIKINSGTGNLKIRAYAASEALPVAGVNVVVSSIVNGEKVIFFKGTTDASGMIETISLPAPKLDESNLIKPASVVYEIEVSKVENDLNESFEVSMYDGVCVIQNINVVPGGLYGN